MREAVDDLVLVQINALEEVVQEAVAPRRGRAFGLHLVLAS